MKADRISKLYEKLGNKEKALLSFHHAVTGNSAEVDRIAATVPLKAYQTRDAEFLDWLRVVQGIAQFWGLQYWTMQAKRVAALGGMFITLGMEDTGKLAAFTEDMEQWERNLLALDAALEFICDQHGLDPIAIRTLSDAEPFRAMTAGLSPDEGYLAEMKECLAGIMGRRGKA